MIPLHQQRRQIRFAPALDLHGEFRRQRKHLGHGQAQFVGEVQAFDMAFVELRVPHDLRDDFVRALDFLLDDLQMLGHIAPALLQGALQRVRGVVDDGERVFDLVRELGGEPARRAELALAQAHFVRLLLEAPLALGQHLDAVTTNRQQPQHAQTQQARFGRPALRQIFFRQVLVGQFVDRGARLVAASRQICGRWKGRRRVGHGAFRAAGGSGTISPLGRGAQHRRGKRGVQNSGAEIEQAQQQVEQQLGRFQRDAHRIQNNQAGEDPKRKALESARQERQTHHEQTVQQPERKHQPPEEAGSQPPPEQKQAPSRRVAQHIDEEEKLQGVQHDLAGG